MTDFSAQIPFVVLVTNMMYDPIQSALIAAMVLHPSDMAFFQAKTPGMNWPELTEQNEEI